MSQYIFNPAAGEQRAIRSGDGAQPEAWTTARNAATSTDNNTTLIVYGGSNSNIQRVFLPFDTSSIPNKASIISATLEFYRDDSIDTFVNDDSTRVDLIQTTQASGTSYGSGDWDSIAWTSGGIITFASTSNDAYNTITLNQPALEWINKTGYTKLCLVTGRDFDDATTPNTNQVDMQNRASGNPIKLTIIAKTLPFPGFFQS